MTGSDDRKHGAPTSALAALLKRAEELGGGAAPVDRWDPPDCGPIPMEIQADGSWHYNGSKIDRERLVRLFASILRREGDGSYVLVTPVEKVTIAVADVPFLAVEIAVEGEGETRVITARTNVGDVIAIGPDHPLRFETEVGTEGLKPYVRVRGGLDARLTRAAAMELVDLARVETVDGVERFGIWSAGAHFVFDPLKDFAADNDPATTAP
ncbi:MAG: DUF1285 domain-containing protein [Pseudomonadota bacterium]